MNRYPLWKYLLVVAVIIIGLFYTLPNFYGEVDAVQISAAKSTTKIDLTLLNRVQSLLDENKIAYTGSQLETDVNGNTIRIRFADSSAQLLAKEMFEKQLNPDPENNEFTIALNMLSASPDWLTAIGARPMYLGLDLRGGVHFLMQVDMKETIQKRYETATNDFRSFFTRIKETNVPSITAQNNQIYIKFESQDSLARMLPKLTTEFPNYQFQSVNQEGQEFTLEAALTEPALLEIKTNAVKQNIITLRNRINELGVSEPVIQQQGADRIIVELPGVKDIAKAKDILGRTATLEVRLVDTSPQTEAKTNSPIVPLGLERFYSNTIPPRPRLVFNQIYFTGENIQNAQACFDNNNLPGVCLQFDAKGTKAFRDMTTQYRGKNLAIILYEKGRGTIISEATMRAEILDGNTVISGGFTLQESHELALLLRAGSLAAPMQIIEERVVGPSLGAENISMGFNSTLYGFLAIAVFICVYYALMGVFSTVALMVNLLLLIAVLSMLQATLTLPGIAAIALTLGMAIDANVLINERIREELRAGESPQNAIHLGFERAWATIIDSNITTLIAGVALLAFGSGPIRGFAVVHCIGILTSMFSAVVVARACSNLWYGRRKKLEKISIGTVWVPTENTDVKGK